MKILEYGDRQSEKIILIHGFQSPYQIWDEYIDYYQKQYHIIVPVLQGHNPEEKEEFVSFSQTAKEIEDYYLSHYGQNVYAIYGMSMGGVVAAKIWGNKNLNIDKIILESSPLVSYNRMMNSILLKQYLMLTHKTQNRDKKVVQQAVNTIIAEDKLENFLVLLDNMTDETISVFLTEVGKYKLPPDINTPNSVVYYFYGSKKNELLAKKTAKYIEKHYPNSKIKCFEGKGHCEDSLLNPTVMIAELDRIFGVN